MPNTPKIYPHTIQNVSVDVYKSNINSLSSYLNQVLAGLPASNPDLSKCQKIVQALKSMNIKSPVSPSTSSTAMFDVSGIQGLEVLYFVGYVGGADTINYKVPTITADHLATIVTKKRAA